MDIRVKTTDYQMTQDVSEYLNGRLRSLEKLLGADAQLARCEVELGRDAGRPRHGANIFFAEIHIICPGGAKAYARNNSESINGAIDDVKEETERQLRRERKLHIRLYRRGGAFAKRLLRLD
ncbi:MAG: Sigma 54 modulation protein / ribosomal protein [Candidatus Parcubacteria bacterium]|jgi:ribosome-associated translation inhibitor RaiA